MRTVPIALLCLVARPRCGSPAPRTVPSQPWGSLADGLRLRPRASTDRSPAGACHGQRAAHSPSLHRPCRAHKAALSLKVIERLRRLGLGQTEQLPHEHCVGSDVRRQTSRERRARRHGQVSGWAFLPSSAVLADAASGTRWCAHSRGTARGNLCQATAQAAHAHPKPLRCPLQRSGLCDGGPRGSDPARRVPRPMTPLRLGERRVASARISVRERRPCQECA